VGPKADFLEKISNAHDVIVAFRAYADGLDWSPEDGEELSWIIEKQIRQLVGLQDQLIRLSQFRPAAVPSNVYNLSIHRSAM